MQKKIVIGFWCLLMGSFVDGQFMPRSDGITLMNCGTSTRRPRPRSRIVGGQPAVHGQYPWMVSLQVPDGPNFMHACGGTILNENWIVTAAHCALLSRPLVVALVGLHNVSNPEPGSVQRVWFSGVYVHPNFNAVNMENDIALLRTSQPIDIAGSQGYANGICLPTSDMDPVGRAIVTGWGHTQAGGISSNVLMEVFVPMLPRDRCKNAYDEISSDQRVTETMICAGATNKDACQNDSGGPLIQREGPVSTLIGIVSFGHGCGYEGFPGVYTKVASYVPWIRQVIAGNLAYAAPLYEEH